MDFVPWSNGAGSLLANLLGGTRNCIKSTEFLRENLEKSFFSALKDVFDSLADAGDDFCGAFCRSDGYVFARNYAALSY